VRRRRESLAKIARIAKEEKKVFFVRTFPALAILARVIPGT